jgi:glutathione S-transferase
VVQLLDQDIKTREVLDWEGLHLFHAQPSSCSQKVRVYLNYKGIRWTSHEVARGDNNKPYYMGINPRGLLPTLVHDGKVHIESNDIILHLEKQFPDPPMIPAAYLDNIEQLLRHEDDLHIPLRTITFRFLMPPSNKPPKSQEDLDAYATTGSGTVLGSKDEAKMREISFYRWFLEGGIPHEAVQAAVSQFKSEFQGLDETLSTRPYLLGDAISILDIAWLVYAHRLVSCGYPVDRLHPHLWQWYEKLASDPRFKDEIAMPPEVEMMQEELRAKARLEGDTLEDVCAL